MKKGDNLNPQPLTIDGDSSYNQLLGFGDWVHSQDAFACRVCFQKNKKKPKIVH